MFYPPTTGRSAFPRDYFGDAFVSMHGSWNRSLRTGYKLVRVRMKAGVPTGEYEDFLTGFIVDDESVWGRPVDTVQLADGSILMSDDANHQIFRISYSGIQSGLTTPEGSQWKSLVRAAQYALSEALPIH